ncbi:BON domain-containing protein [Legionella donaldsonii]|uniref:BON domain-containing protein n=1 Tax=Legionella donaldsonii TaxID=45060 RepID=UPI000E1BEB4B|nr:BON domain-containing protein [Legionella donaldsonii]
MNNNKKGEMMRKYYQGMLIALGFSLLTGCQMFSGGNLFQPRLSDESLTASVNTAFINTPELAPVRIHVEAHNGIVLLSGYVKTIRQSDTAGDVASKVNGVKGVENNLIVRK